MKTEWDYTNLADAYLKRPDYSEIAIDSMIKLTDIVENDKICDVGAGVAHLTLMLAKRKFNVSAIEPNDAMRKNGIERTISFKNVIWHEGTGEKTDQKSSSFEMVTFGSSFNVCNRLEALKEVSRILKPNGWFACMWNNRDLSDPIQLKIEEIIKNNLNDYSYGTRRETQTSIIDSSKLFNPVIHLSSNITHLQPIDECIRAWYSHATLERQAGDKFKNIVLKIENYLNNLYTDSIEIPYTTNIWIAQKR